MLDACSSRQKVNARGAKSPLDYISSSEVVDEDYGINREYLFECVVIMIDWIVLIVSGILLSVVFKRAMRMSS